MEFLRRRSGELLAVLGGLVALQLALGYASSWASIVISDVTHVLVAVGAGLLLIRESAHRHGSDRKAWILFGVGVALSGLGDFTWGWYELGLGVEPPFPGLADVFYLAPYPAYLAAVLLTPRVAANRYQRANQILDGIVVTTGVALVAWLTVLEPMYLAAGESTLAELLVGGGYPIGDVLLIATVGTIGIKRSRYLNDQALWCVVGALLFMALGDILYLTQTWAGTYVSGSPVDASWVASYSLFALAASRLHRPIEPRVPRDRSRPLWHLAVPLAILFGFITFYIVRQLTTGWDGSPVMEAILAALSVLVALRFLVTIAEDRSLVDEERKQLVSVVSHELRTPLTAVQGYLDLALSDWEAFDDESRREMVEIAHDQVRLVTRIVTDLIASSRDSLHSTRLNLEPVQVDGLIREVVDVLGMTARVTVDVEPGSCVIADRERVIQIVTNYLTNADRFGNGEIACVVRGVEGQIEVQVHDNGAGVPARYREAIWQRFDRGPRRFDASTPGSGLGLAIVQSLVQAHGGTSAYRTSERLGGACFWVRLPSGRLPTESPGLVDTGIANSN